MAIPKYKDSNGQFQNVPMFGSGTDGWFTFPASLTYAAGATSPLFNVNINADVTSRVGSGMEIKLFQDSTVKKFIVMSITANTAQLYGTSGNALTSSTITNVYYSPTVPLGYPPADFPLETGNTGIWTWVKWFSGKAECWTIDNQTITLNNSVAIGGGYRDINNWPFALNLPFTFVKVPVAKININSSAQVYIPTERCSVSQAMFLLVSYTGSGSDNLAYKVTCSDGTWK